MTNPAGFILSEDRALKAHLGDMFVGDQKNPNRKVGVWFGQPDLEIRKQSYPYITIDLIDVREATERTHRGYDIELQYVPYGMTVAPGEKVILDEYPIPYDLMYQVTTFARDPRHDRQIINEIMLNRFGGRMHSLYVPDDDTSRSMFLVGSRKRDSTEDNRRLFSNAYTVVVYSELFPKQVSQRFPVSTINRTFTETN